MQTVDGNFEKFYNKALKFLSYRPRSEKEVRDKMLGLIKKNKKLATTETQNEYETLNSKIVDKVINKLKEHKFIDDEEFAKSWIRSRLEYKPRSINLIKRELLQKGIDKELVDAQISNFQFPISNELDNAQKLIKKRWARYKDLSRQKIYEKLGRYLASKGFDWDTIKKAIDPVKS